MYSFVHFKISPPHIVYGGEKSKTIKNLMRNVASCYIFTNLSVSDLIENSWILISVSMFKLLPYCHITSGKLHVHFERIRVKRANKNLILL